MTFVFSENLWVFSLKGKVKSFFFKLKNNMSQALVKNFWHILNLSISWFRKRLRQLINEKINQYVLSITKDRRIEDYEIDIHNYELFKELMEIIWVAIYEQLKSNWFQINKFWLYIFNTNWSNDIKDLMWKESDWFIIIWKSRLSLAHTFTNEIINFKDNLEVNKAIIELFKKFECNSNRILNIKIISCNWKKYVIFLLDKSIWDINKQIDWLMLFEIEDINFDLKKQKILFDILSCFLDSAKWELLDYIKLHKTEVRSRNVVTWLPSRFWLEQKLNEKISSFTSDRKNVEVFKEILTRIKNWQEWFCDIENDFNINTLFVLSFFDVDNFKSINDTFWHKVWDKILRLIWNKLSWQDWKKRLFRKSDFAYSYWWDEMAVIMEYWDFDLIWNSLVERMTEIKNSIIDYLKENFEKKELFNKFDFNKIWLSTWFSIISIYDVVKALNILLQKNSEFNLDSDRWLNDLNDVLLSIFFEKVDKQWLYSSKDNWKWRVVWVVWNWNIKFFN